MHPSFDNCPEWNWGWFQGINSKIDITALGAYAYFYKLSWKQHRGAQVLRYMFNQGKFHGHLHSTSARTQRGYIVHSRYWNLSHGHFLQMGGFVICTSEGDEKSKFILTPEQLKDFSERQIIDFSKEVKPYDIKNRSKGNGLTYFVAIGQLLWFVTQCIARTAVGLSVTLFELVAVSFAPLTIIMYILWWRKPQNAQAPIGIIVKKPKEISINPEQQRKSRSDVWHAHKHNPAESSERLFFPLSFIQHAINTFEDMLGTTHRSQSIPPWSRKLPPFYAYPHEHDPSKIPENPLITGSILGTIFGIIHIIGCNFKFPSRIEELLWWASSVIIIVAPLLAVYNVFSARKSLHREVKESPSSVAVAKENNKRESTSSEAKNSSASQQSGSPGHIFRQVWYAFVAAVLALGYIIARLILLGVMCSSLRKLPGKQLQGVDWITDIPHIL